MTLTSSSFVMESHMSAISMYLHERKRFLIQSVCLFWDQVATGDGYVAQALVAVYKPAHFKQVA